MTMSGVIARCRNACGNANGGGCLLTDTTGPALVGVIEVHAKGH